MKTRYIIALAAAALMFSGCQKNELSGGNAAGENDGILKFRLSGLQLTKGELINSEAEMLEAGIDTFRVQAWYADCRDFLTEQTVTYSTEKSMWQTAEPIVWTGTDSKTFFAYTNLPETGATVTNTCTSDSRKQTLAYTLPLDARQQNDIMLGWYGGDGNGESTADITLIHPLSSIVLKQGEMDVDDIKSITVSGLYASGTVDVTYAAGTGGIVPTYDWGETRTGSVASTLTPTGSDTYISVDADGIIGTPFIVIPQSVAANQVKITVTASVSGADKNLTVSVPAGAFVAGETHVFMLGYEDPNHHDWVEIGGRKWATCCIGATSPKDYGLYFFWGDTEGYIWDSANSKWVKASDPTAELSGGFSWANTTHHTGGSSITGWTKYIPTGKSSYWSGGGSPDDKLVLDPEDDIAHVNWGGSWRMPTQADFQALYEACGGTGTEKNSLVALPSANPPQGIYRVTADQTYISDYNGVAGILFCDGTNKLFFPAAGYGNGANLDSAGSKGHYWSSSLDTSNPAQAYYLYFTTSYVGPQRVLNRCDGRSIRPVLD